MIDLSENSLSAWLSRRPDDVRAFISDGEARDADGFSALAGVLAGAQAFEVPEILRRDPDGARALGRLGRVRLMARVAAGGGNDAALVMRRITGEDDVDGGAGGRDAVGILFLEDLKEWARTVLAPRVAARATSPEVLGTAAEAAFTLESDLVLRQGGI